MEISEKTKSYLLAIAAILGVVVVSLLVLIPKGGGDEAGETRRKSGLTQEIADPEREEVDRSKMSIYRKNRGMEIDDYWDNLGSSEGISDMEEQGSDRRRGGAAMSAPDGLSGMEVEPPKMPSADEVIQEYLRKQEALDRQRAQAVPVTPAPAPAPQGRQKPAPVEAAPVQETPSEEPVMREEAKPVMVKRVGAIGSLGEEVDDSFGGFSSLEQDVYVEKEAGHPYKCMFFRQEKLRSGQRVAVRLLEDLLVGTMVVPRNSRLMGTVNISSRIMLAFSSLELNGRIYEIDFSAYDTDGAEGIYCSQLNQYAKQLESQGLSQAGSLLSRGLGGIAGNAAQVGMSIAQSKSGEVTVTVPAGYTFYIMEDRR